MASFRPGQPTGVSHAKPTGVASPWLISTGSCLSATNNVDHFVSLWYPPRAPPLTLKSRLSRRARARRRARQTERKQSDNFLDIPDDPAAAVEIEVTVINHPIPQYNNAFQIEPMLGDMNSEAETDTNPMAGVCQYDPLDPHDPLPPLSSPSSMSTSPVLVDSTGSQPASFASPVFDVGSCSAPIQVHTAAPRPRTGTKRRKRTRLTQSAPPDWHSSLDQVMLSLPRSAVVFDSSSHSRSASDSTKTRSTSADADSSDSEDWQDATASERKVDSTADDENNDTLAPTSSAKPLFLPRVSEPPHFAKSDIDASDLKSREAAASGNRNAKRSLLPAIRSLPQVAPPTTMTEADWTAWTFQNISPKTEPSNKNQQGSCPRFAFALSWCVSLFNRDTPTRHRLL